MNPTLRLQGRFIGTQELADIQALLQQLPSASRYQLSRALASLWDWRSPAGHLKDMAARSLLLKLEQRALLTLPPRRRPSPNRMRHKRPRPIAHDTTPIETPLASLRPVQWQEVSADPRQRALLDWLLGQYHYLGWRGTVGANLQYLARDGQGRVLAVSTFGAAAWRCAARDRFVGWTEGQRRTGLSGVLNQSRFLIVPWVRVRHLASHLLGRLVGRLAADGAAKYRHAVWLVETFVQRDRFAGTCYRAANWQWVGTTTGRSRQDELHRLRVAVKDVYLYPLGALWRQGLTAEVQP